MTTRDNHQSQRRELRLWPGVAILILQWLARFVMPVFFPDVGDWGALAAPLGMIALIVWWMFFSRAPWAERFGALALMAVAVIATRYMIHESVRLAGMGFLFFIYVTPLLSLALVGWAALSRGLARTPRLLALVACVVVACGVWIPLRTGGITGGGDSDFGWRWAKTPEERLLAAAQDEQLASPAVAAVSAPAPVAAEAEAMEPPVEVAEEVVAPPVEVAEEVAATLEPEQMAAIDAAATATSPVVAAPSPPEWPGFRGPNRDSVVHGVTLASDWSVSPPVELWRHAIGPGWSSFSVDGDLFYTQEQRGEDEIVSCYRMSTGEPVWRHSDATRFWESNGGAGPRATPTLHAGRAYTLGATGRLNALDAADGSVLWSRDAAADTGAEVPGWGFSSSPLIVDDVLVVYVGALVGYELSTGELRWQGPLSGSYSSPQLMTVDGVEQVVILNGGGAAGFAAATGEQLWRHSAPGGIVQPAMTANGDLLLNGAGLTGGTGMRRVAVARADRGAASAELRGNAGWTVEERWMSTRFKPNFNDFVVHEGQAYGFDARILAALDLETGERLWKGGRYGYGQLLLLADQDILLVLSEKGALALVEARPEGFKELALFPAIEGKTWNHPVLIGDVVLVRNGEEMAAFRLPLAEG